MRAHASPPFVCDSIRSTAAERSPSRCHRERCTPAAARRLSAKAETTSVDWFDRLFWVGLSGVWRNWRCVLDHLRRQVLHFNVTEHPTADWTSQQIVEAFADRDAPRYLIRDRDSIYGSEVRLRIASLGIEEVLAAPLSPWQNSYIERLIGSIRRDCLNHFVILNARHLKRILASYFVYYHGSRTHLGLDKLCPIPRQLSSIGRIITIPQLGGLYHRYERVAA